MKKPGDLVRPVGFGVDLVLYHDVYADQNGKARRDAVGIITDKTICLVLATHPHPNGVSVKVQLLLLTSMPHKLGWSWDDFFEPAGCEC